MSRKRKAPMLFPAVAMAGVAAYLAIAFGRRPPGDGGGAPSVQAITELSELTTLKVLLADVQSTRLDGVTGGAEADLVVRGEITVSTDPSRARFASVDPAAHTAVLVLPQPEASPLRIDHGKTRVIVRQTGIWAVLPGGNAQAAILTRAFRDAERELASGGTGSDREEYRSLARRRAEGVLKAFFGRVGWAVTVRWE